jgi:hypothetical protein
MDLTVVEEQPQPLPYILQRTDRDLVLRPFLYIPYYNSRIEISIVSLRIFKVSEVRKRGTKEQSTL